MDLKKEILKEFNEKQIANDIISYSKYNLDERKNKDKVIGYLNKRKIGLETVKYYLCGFLCSNIQNIIPRMQNFDKFSGLINSNNSIIFPSFRSSRPDSFLSVVRYIGRDDLRYKIIKLSNDSNNFYYWGLYDTDIIIVEGIFDMLRCTQSDLYSIPSNGTRFSAEQLSLLFPNAKNITLFLDGDSTGINKTLDIVYSYLSGKFEFNLYVIKTPLGKDPNDISEKTIKSLYNNRMGALDYFYYVLNKNLCLTDEKQLTVYKSIKNFIRNV